jgi:hypothetical protein
VAFDHDDLGQVGELGPQLQHLLELVGVLDESDLGIGVADDVGNLLG